ncbi:hypothetical protein EV1_032037 [Malus domestica]
MSPMEMLRSSESDQSPAGSRPLTRSDPHRSEIAMTLVDLSSLSLRLCRNLGHPEGTQIRKHHRLQSDESLAAEAIRASSAHRDSSLSFYRDLLLLFNNAVVFFPKSSLGLRTAHQLRRLVLNEMKKKNLITRPNHDPSSEPSDSVVPAPATSQQPKRPE